MEETSHTELIDKFESLTQQLKVTLTTLRAKKATMPQENIRDLLVAYRELKETVAEIRGELVGIALIKKINARALLGEVPEGYVSSKTGMSRENAVGRLNGLNFGGRKTRKHRKRR
jgi:predicted lipase